MITYLGGIMKADFQLLTIARRAYLGSEISNKYNEAKKKIATAKEYNNKVLRSLNNDKDLIEFHLSVCLIGILAIKEAFLNDTLTEYIACFPGHSDGKDIKLDMIAKKGSIGQIVQSLAETKVHQLSYKKFSEFHQELSNIISLKNPIDENLIKEISEIKATRDVYVHANGKCNDTYIYKSGDFAREKSIGKMLPLTEDYVVSSVDKIDSYLSQVFSNIPEKIKSYGKAKAFKEMWNKSALSKINSFDKFWEIVEKDMVRPKDDAFKWHWSYSEKAAFDFFLGIYNVEHPERTIDIMQAIKRWPSESSTGKVIRSWMDAPFYF